MSTETANNKRNTIVQYETTRGPVQLSIASIKSLFCPLATDVEAYTFLRICQYQGLNPFLREAYLIKYDKNKPASIVVGKDTFTQRAERHPQFLSMRAGITVMSEGTVTNVEGALLLPNDTLLGGWAEVSRRDRAEPFSIRVSLKEYDTGQSSWKRMPATMIRKVALVQALREAFPQALAGLYDADEIGLESPEAIEGEVIATDALTIQADADDADLNPDGLPDGLTAADMTEYQRALENLQDAVASAGLDWQEWQRRYLSRWGGSIEGFLKTAGSLDDALSLVPKEQP